MRVSFVLLVVAAMLLAYAHGAEKPQLQPYSLVETTATATAEQKAYMQDPGVNAAMNAKTPDSVDKLIQGILDGTGNGGVVTTEFNEGGVHATIISNVNELKVTEIDDATKKKSGNYAEQSRKTQLKNQIAKAQEEARKTNADTEKLTKSS